MSQYETNESTGVANGKAALKDVTALAKEGIHEGERMITRMALSVSQFSARAMAKAKAKWDGTVSEATHLVQKYPLESVLVSFGSGFVLGSAVFGIRGWSKSRKTSKASIPMKKKNGRSSS